MPFDPVDYTPPRLPYRPPRRLSGAGETIVLRLVFLWLVLMLLLPFSAGTFDDIVRYVEGP